MEIATGLGIVGGCIVDFTRAGIALNKRNNGGRRMVKLTINGKVHDVEVADDTPLLWVLRDTLGLTGTKYGCGMALCGACTVHIDGEPTRS
ncbi:MAG TPA: 2Fe-2S iron-sulfur cluster-binding protein, partial [Povalibacter sp.]